MISRLAGALLMAAALSGCSIRIQAPVREVAYDFSDRDFYDRAYAPSPAYAASPAPARAPRRAPRAHHVDAANDAHR